LRRAAAALVAATAALRSLLLVGRCLTVLSLRLLCLPTLLPLLFFLLLCIVLLLLLFLFSTTIIILMPAPCMLLLLLHFQIWLLLLLLLLLPLRSLLFAPPLARWRAAPFQAPWSQRVQLQRCRLVLVFWVWDEGQIAHNLPHSACHKILGRFKVRRLKVSAGAWGKGGSGKRGGELA
jgi:hypothetical protein